MARATLTKSTAPGQWPTAGVVVTMTAASVASSNQFAHTGKEILIVQNTATTTSYTFTVNTIADSHGRTGNISAENIAPAVVKCLGPFSALEGWRQTDGMLYLQANNAKVKFGVLVQP